MTSLQEKRKINVNLKDKLVRQKEENTKFLMKKEALLTNVDHSLMVPNLTISSICDSSLKRRSNVQPMTSKSLSYHYCVRIKHNFKICNIKEEITNGVYRWVTEEKSIYIQGLSFSTVIRKSLHQGLWQGPGDLTYYSDQGMNKISVQPKKDTILPQSRGLQASANIMKKVLWYWGARC